MSEGCGGHVETGDIPHLAIISIVEVDGGAVGTGHETATGGVDGFEHVGSCGCDGVDWESSGDIDQGEEGRECESEEECGLHGCGFDSCKIFL